MFILNMFETYRVAIKAVYDRNKKGGKFSHLLNNPTCANLRESCKRVYEERQFGDNDPLLKEFMDRHKRYEDYSSLIFRKDPEDFKSISKFLNGRTNTPTIKTLEVIAWLIDFQPRPYTKDLDAVIKERYRWAFENRRVAVTGGSLKKVIVILLVLSIIVIAGFSVPLLFENNQCMQWKSDHYEQVSCDSIVDGADVTPLDEIRLARFKMITRPDTLTYYSVGKVWYSKKAGKLDYFTANGDHPTDKSRDLRPLTVYILEKYLTKH